MSNNSNTKTADTTTTTECDRCSVLEAEVAVLKKQNEECTAKIAGMKKRNAESNADCTAAMAMVKGELNLPADQRLKFLRCLQRVQMNTAEEMKSDKVPTKTSKCVVECVNRSQFSLFCYGEDLDQAAHLDCWYSDDGVLVTVNFSLHRKPYLVAVFVRFEIDECDDKQLFYMTFNKHNRPAYMSEKKMDEIKHVPGLDMIKYNSDQFATIVRDNVVSVLLEHCGKELLAEFDRNKPLYYGRFDSVYSKSDEIDLSGKSEDECLELLKQACITRCDQAIALGKWYGIKYKDDVRQDSPITIKDY